MTQNEFAAALTDRLRGRGVDFRQNEVEAFAAKAWMQDGASPDLDVLAERFLVGKAPGNVKGSPISSAIAAFQGALVGAVATEFSVPLWLMVLGTLVKLAGSKGVSDEGASFLGCLLFVFMWIPGSLLGAILAIFFQAKWRSLSGLLGGGVGGLVAGAIIAGCLLAYFPR